MMSAPILERVIALRCSPAHAFAVFTGKTDLWWPRHHRRTEAAAMVLEPRLGGRLLERSPDGNEWVIGTITDVTRYKEAERALEASEADAGDVRKG